MIIPQIPTRIEIIKFRSAIAIMELVGTDKPIYHGVFVLPIFMGAKATKWVELASSFVITENCSPLLKAFNRSNFSPVFKVNSAVWFNNSVLGCPAYLASWLSKNAYDPSNCLSLIFSTIS